jgi:hypothetical protein
MARIGDGQGRTLLHMPTGAGKTRTAMHIVAQALGAREPSLVVWLASTKELLEQAAEAFLLALPSLGDREVDVGSAAQFRRGPKSALPDAVFAHALMEFWRARYPSRRHLSIETVSSDVGSPGRVFLLDEDSVAERLERIDVATSGAVWWDESSGLRQVACREPEAVDPLSLNLPERGPIEVAA